MQVGSGSASLPRLKCGPESGRLPSAALGPMPDRPPKAAAMATSKDQASACGNLQPFKKVLQDSDAGVRTWCEAASRNTRPLQVRENEILVLFSKKDCFRESTPIGRRSQAA